MPPKESGVEDDDARDRAILELLALCAEREVDVPSGLVAALIGDKEAAEDAEAGEEVSLLDSFLSERAAELAAFEDSDLIKRLQDTFEALKKGPSPWELRVSDGSYTVTNYVDASRYAAHKGGGDRRKPVVDTVITAAPAANFVKKCLHYLKTGEGTFKKRKEEKVLLDGANLVFETGKMYLILGAPGAGKSTLLKYIADTLRKDNNHVRGGTVSLNGITPAGKSVHWSNLVAFIDQIDRLHPYMTVEETFRFAWLCTSGGTHRRLWHDMDDPQVRAKIEEMDIKESTVATVMEGLGLTRVKDTFVGDNSTVRGVSGGERKRVTVGEMFCVGAPVVCCDEISTGLDAATTYDIIKLLSEVGKLTGTVRLVSLLQPPPETVAIFDELVLVDSGLIIYSGPVNDVVSYFESLGYAIPDRMDVADWLQALPTPDGKNFLKDPETEHLTSEQFREKFDASNRAKDIKEKLSEAFPGDYTETAVELASPRYRNNSLKSLQLLVRREMLLWWRDKYQIKARVMQDLIMGIIAGTLFWQQGDVPQSISGILFQAMFFISMGAMLKIQGQFDVRGILYKQQDANFFPTWSYVIGRSLAGVPTAIIDGIVFGTVIYWFVGLVASVANYFVFMLLVMIASLTAGLLFSIFSAVVKDKSTSQACMSVAIVVLVLFSGFTVQANVIPNYWIWVYWMNMFAWVLRALNVNEFQTSKWDEPQSNGYTAGENILIRFGFTLNGEPFEYSWVWYSIVFCVGLAAVSSIFQVIFLNRLRFESGLPLGVAEGDDDEEEDVTPTVEIPFQKVDLTFKDIRYTVKASTTKDYIELLKGIDGFVSAGKMTALMGSSGAGKTTLMDVLALRKTSGEISGEVCLNGHLQEPLTFRRCSGYVEQFDEQQPQLTIRETVEFSALLRLDDTDPAVTRESTEAFVNQTLKMLELTDIENLQVGTDATGGLSFEEKKRLSIAVELVANPSVLFLDEPTSGLDARAASIVMRGLKRIALTGRAVCATIHQPSIAIFNSFDSLLLLKRGGEVVFFGELGEESSHLIEYLERYEATPKIKPGENPATWMLTTIGAGSSGGKVFDYAGSYASSKLKEANLAQIDKICGAATDDNLVSFSNMFATSTRTQSQAVLSRMFTIYWRSPSYNLVRLFVSMIVSLLFGSVYVTQRVPEDESDMNSRVTSIFITFLFLAVNSFNTVLNVFYVVRDMYYRHRDALMYSGKSILLAFTLAELPFILLASMIFVVPFYFMVGFAVDAGKFFLYYLFFTLNLGLFTFLGQMMMSLFRDPQTAQGFGGVLIGMTSLFSGLLIRPQNIPTFWIFAYWLLPGHYVLEGLLTSQFQNDDTPIEASEGSPFWESLGCTESPCYGTAEGWINVSFGGFFTPNHIPWNILYLFGAAAASRVITYIALTRLNYLAK